MEEDNFNTSESLDKSTPSGWSTLGDLAKQETWEQHVAKAKEILSESHDAAPLQEAHDEPHAIEKMSDEELWQIGNYWNDITIDEEALQEAIMLNPQPNVTNGRGLFFGEERNLPMSADAVYRHVGSDAIRDLLNVGFVRNKRVAVGAIGKGGRGFGTVGEKVYWYPGKEGVNERADLLIEADKVQAEQGYVTKDFIRGIWITDPNTGDPVNLIAQTDPEQ